MKLLLIDLTILLSLLFLVDTVSRDASIWSWVNSASSGSNLADWLLVMGTFLAVFLAFKIGDRQSNIFDSQLRVEKLNHQPWVIPYIKDAEWQIDVRNETKYYCLTNSGKALAKNVRCYTSKVNYGDIAPGDRYRISIPLRSKRIEDKNGKVLLAGIVYENGLGEKFITSVTFKEDEDINQVCGIRLDRDMSTKTYDDIIHLLEKHGCQYTTQHHEPTRTSEIASRVRRVSMHSGAKAIVAKGDKTGANYLFVMPADMKLWGSRAKQVCGESVGFAQNPEEVTGCVPGSVPPFGSLIGLKTFVDPHLAQNEIIHFNAGSLTDSVSMRYEDWLAIEKPLVVEIAKSVDSPLLF